MEQPRKRPRPEDSDAHHNKKRAISDNRDSPVAVNGASSDEPRDGDNLEMFRKDAIFRRMKHYARENARSQARVAELERRRNSCEAGLAALEASWVQLLSTIQLHTKSKNMPSSTVDTRDIYDLTKHVSSDADPQYVEQLRSKMHATEQLVTAFMRAAGEVGSAVLKDEPYRRYQKSETECAALRSEVSLLVAKLKQTERDREQYKEQLVAAEIRLDRLRSKTVATLNPTAYEGAQDSAVIKEERAEKKVEISESTSASPGPSSSYEAVALNGDAPADAEQWEAIARLREQKIEELQRELDRVQAELVNAHFDVKAAAESQFQATPYAKYLHGYIYQLKHTLSEHRGEILKLNKEVASIRETRNALQEELAAITETHQTELQNAIQKRDVENLRLRQSRDANTHELAERRAKDGTRSSSVDEFKNLAETRAERIQVLTSEVSRLRARIASQSGDEDVLQFLAMAAGEDSSLVENLKTQLVDAEMRLKAIKDAPVSEVEAKKQLLQANKQLQRFKSMFGDASSDASGLAEQLRTKESELENLRLQLQEREQADAPLYSELERLSTLWEALDKQVQSKIFDLSSMEEKLNKMLVEKAKADNRYYAAMRDKEALEQEKKTLTRNQDKHAKSLEKVSEAEKHASARARDLEKQSQLATIAYKEMEVKLHEKERDFLEVQARSDMQRHKLDEFEAALKEYVRDIGRRRQDLLKIEESLLKKQKEAEKLTAKAKTIASSNPSSSNAKEVELQEEVDKCMSILKCSTCKQNMRNTVITKCMHSFCRNCVNERIQSRQRKCPACNLPFSQGEVQALYFQ